jgi:preprotein translocase subunit SecE
MDVKLNQTQPSSDVPAQQASKKRSVFRFVRELREELRKVSWTTQEELKLSTKVVVGAIFFFGLGIYLVDLVVKGCLDFIALVVHLIFG